MGGNGVAEQPPTSNGELPRERPAWAARVGARSEPAGPTRPDEAGRAAEAAPAVAAVAQVAVVITTSASDTKYFATALQSVLKQTVRPDQVVVVDDASPDGAEIEQQCRQAGATYLRVQTGSSGATRQAGVEQTNSTYVLCLDADNELLPNWLERHLAETEPQVGVVYAAAERMDTDGRTIGPYQPVMASTRDELRRQNRIDTCALVRRDAIDEAGGWGLSAGIKRLEDWHLWLRLTATGWRSKFIDETLWRYRDNPQGITAASSPEEYQATRQRVMRELYQLWVVTPFCGREWALQRTLASYRRLGWPKQHCHLLAIDNSRDEGFGYRLRMQLATTCHDWVSVTVVGDPTYSLGATATEGQPVTAGVTNADFAAEADLRVRHELALSWTVRRLYAELTAQHLPPAADLVFTLEDDVELVTDDAPVRLLEALDPNVMVAGAVVNVRYVERAGAGPIAWNVTSEDPYRAARVEMAGDSPLAVGGVAYGATLWRAEAWRRLMPRRLLVNDRPGEAPPWHDLVFAADVRRAGHQMMLHPGVLTRHWREDGTWV